MNLQELEALIKLLEDNDSFVLDQVEGKLKEYFKTVPSSIWSQLIHDAPKIAKERLESLFSQYNFNLILDKSKAWMENPVMLSEALYLIAKIFNPFLEYHDFLALIMRYVHYFPKDFSKNMTPLEQANFINELFYKELEYQWIHKQPLSDNLNPEYVLRNLKGSHITMALIIVAILQHLGIFWVVLSDMTLTHTFIVIPTNPRKKLYFFMDPRTGFIKSNSNLSKQDVEELLRNTAEHYNLLSLKSLIVAYLQKDVLPREYDDQWYLLNRINSLIASYGKKS